MSELLIELFLAHRAFLPVLILCQDKKKRLSCNRSICRRRCCGDQLYRPPEFVFNGRSACHEFVLTGGPSHGLTAHELERRIPSKARGDLYIRCDQLQQHQPSPFRIFACLSIFSQSAAVPYRVHRNIALNFLEFFGSYFLPPGHFVLPKK